MTSEPTPIDYKSGTRSPKSAPPGMNDPVRIATGTGGAVITPHGRLAAIDEFLHVLARAVRQFHTYPATSPLCAEAVAASHTALTAFDDGDRLALRVTPRELVVDDTGLGGGTIVEHELVRRLHKARVAGLDID